MGKFGKGTPEQLLWKAVKQVQYGYYCDNYSPNYSWGRVVRALLAIIARIHSEHIDD